MRKFRSFLFFSWVIAAAGCNTGGSIISVASAPTDGPKANGPVLNLTGNPNPNPSGGPSFIESYITIADAGTATIPPKTVVCNPGEVFLCNADCGHDTYAQAECNEQGNGFVQPTTPVAYGICFCPEGPWEFPDAATTQPPPSLDAGVPDTIVIAQPDAAQPDTSPDMMIRTDTNIPDVYVPDVYIVTVPDTAPDITKTVYVPPVTITITPDAAWGPETGKEAGPESGPESGPELGPEPGPEPGPDAGPDLVVVPDTTPDTMPDILPTPDLGPDTAACTPATAWNKTLVATLKDYGDVDLTWETDGCSKNGFKVFWRRYDANDQTSLLPTYPDNYDDYQFLGSVNAHDYTVENLDSGTWVFRACRYQGGDVCGAYSNTVTVTIP